MHTSIIKIGEGRNQSGIHIKHPEDFPEYVVNMIGSVLEPIVSSLVIMRQNVLKHFVVNERWANVVSYGTKNLNKYLEQMDTIDLSVLEVDIKSSLYEIELRNLEIGFVDNGDKKLYLISDVERFGQRFMERMEDIDFELIPGQNAGVYYSAALSVVELKDIAREIVESGMMNFLCNPDILFDDNDLLSDSSQVWTTSLSSPWLEDNRKCEYQLRKWGKMVEDIFPKGINGMDEYMKEYLSIYFDILTKKESGEEIHLRIMAMRPGDSVDKIMYTPFLMNNASGKVVYKDLVTC